MKKNAETFAWVVDLVACPGCKVPRGERCLLRTDENACPHDLRIVLAHRTATKCGWCLAVAVAEPMGRCEDCGALRTSTTTSGPGVWHIPRREREYDARGRGVRGARDFLRALTALIPPSDPFPHAEGEKPNGMRHHGLTLQDGGPGLIVQLQHDACGATWWSFTLDERDLDRDPHLVAREVLQLLEATVAQAKLAAGQA